MSLYDTFRQAVLGRNSMKVTYKDRVRLVCPHTLGTKNGKPKVLTYQYAGESSSGLPPGGEWRCMFLDEVQSAEITGNDWYTNEDQHSRPQTCVDLIDVESE